MNYMIGCNYWDSQSGTEMWVNFSADTINDDFKQLSSYGIEYLRVFPNWRDFQPIKSLKTVFGNHSHYCMSDESELDNEFGIDSDMLEKFETLCNIAEKYKIKLIVSLVTGWMSGRLFVPQALEDKNLITDPEVLVWTEKFVRGFVRHFKDNLNIVAWDLGNECNCMEKVTDRNQAYLWASHVRNAIVCEDQSRIVMSGLHGIDADSKAVWRIADQGEITDMLTVHPYPSPSIGGDTDPLNQLKTSLLPTIQCQYYSDIGGKPAMIQEQGSLNRMVANRDASADFLRVNMLSGWANGSKGYLWWCAHEQINLNFFPYSYSMRELGLLDTNKQPKPAAIEMKRISDMLRALPIQELPGKDIDAVCVVSMEQKQWHIAATTAILAKQAGFEVCFRHYTQDIPKASVYLLPSIAGWKVIDKNTYQFLIDRVYSHGANLYVSEDSGVLERFEEVFGLVSSGMRENSRNQKAEFLLGKDRFSLPFKYSKELLLENDKAEILSRDEQGNIVFSRHKYGKGNVYYLGFPLEKMLWSKPDIYNQTDELPYYKIYSEVAGTIIAKNIVCSGNKQIGVTQHRCDDGTFVIVAVNYSNKPQNPDFEVQEGWELSPLYGNSTEIKKCDAGIYMARPIKSRLAK
jgi:endo-1,4-beta-mannosidase